MLRRKYALPVAQAQCSVDATDEDRAALQPWRAAHPAHPSMNWDTVQPVIGRGAIRRAGWTVKTSDVAGGERAVSRTDVADPAAGTAATVSAGQAAWASRARAVRRLTARRYFLR